MSDIEIGCCGAFCGTCAAFSTNACKGCKIGYLDKSRDLKKAKCPMKVCCLSKGLITCADCEKFVSCDMLNGFYNKNGYKYKKYQDAAVYIRQNGYEAFLRAAVDWKNAYGNLKRPASADNVFESEETL